MERALFTYDAWDGDHDSMIFYNVTLKVPNGKFKKGDKFSSVCIERPLKKNYGVLQLFGDKDKLVGQFMLHYTLGEEIK